MNRLGEGRRFWKMDEQAISQREYDIVRNHLTDVVEELRQAREGSVDTQDLNAQLEIERVRSQEVQATADEAVRAREQSESQLATARVELQVLHESWLFYSIQLLRYPGSQESNTIGLKSGEEAGVLKFQNGDFQFSFKNK
ncbi:hypothetical protein IMSHALPRED_000060 [Imshaugia aleurites]|uniref:Uncharacterized protein n=1 Tax=Imshaugia aleurites TaxID=172621 RepID=A0A8H3I4L9_9LECA|nr:hypothetical protein IMSHALPRED_000060 [Imshaugia aleurites]